MINLYKEIDFSKQLSEDPEIERFLKQAAKSMANEQSEELRKMKKPIFDEHLQNHLIVTGIPKLNEANEQQFKTVFTEGSQKKKGLLKAKNLLEGLQDIEYGFKLVEGKKQYNQTIHLIYQTAAQAKKAFHKLNNLKFDKNHVFSCFTVKEFQDVEKLQDEYRPPNYFYQEELQSYNFHEYYAEQFVFREKRNEGSKLALNWFDYIQKTPETALQGDQEEKAFLPTTTNKMIWSPRGSYLAVCEDKGVVLYGGKNMQKKAFYEHKKAFDVAFSPNETFMITFNGNDASVKGTDNLILWGVEEQIKIRAFRAFPHQDTQSFQWTADERKLAIVGNNQLFIFQSETVKRLKEEQLLSEEELVGASKLSVIQNLQKILWLPDNKNVLCVCYESNPVPNSHPTSKIFYYNTETKEEKKWKAIGQHIKKAEITLSDNGDWISVSYKKLQKKNQNPTTVQIVDLTKREIETTIENFKESVGNISWDKKFARFAVTCQDPTTIKSVHIKYNVMFYQIQTRDKIQQAVKIGEVHGTSANRVMLGQNGQYFALYNISQNSSGRGKFSIGYFAKDNKSKKQRLEFVKENVDIAYMNFFSMDESSRFILLGTDKSYQIWSFAGEMLHKDIFTQEINDVQFRPRFISKVTDVEEKEIQKREKKIKEKFEDMDKKRINALEYAREQEKQKKRLEFKQYMQSKKKWFAQFQEARQKLLGFNQKTIKTEQYVHLTRERN